MEAYQERVVEEKKELDSKVEKLDHFLNNTTGLDSIVDDVEKRRLHFQLNVMSSYSLILGDRIANFN